MSQEQADTIISLRVSSSVVEFIINTLNRNPLGAPVMQVAGIIGDLGQQAQEAVKAASEPKTGAAESVKASAKAKS